MHIIRVCNCSTTFKGMRSRFRELHKRVRRWVPLVNLVVGMDMEREEKALEDMSLAVAIMYLHLVHHQTFLIIMVHLLVRHRTFLIIMVHLLALRLPSRLTTTVTAHRLPSRLTTGVTTHPTFRPLLVPVHPSLVRMHKTAAFLRLQAILLREAMECLEEGLPSLVPIPTTVIQADHSSLVPRDTRSPTNIAIDCKYKNVQVSCSY